MNDVLDHDRRLIERGRATAGNLAHALKTPVSVMMTRVEKLPAAERDKMRQELERINAAVRHHLARASAAGSSALAAEVHVGQVLAPVLEGLTRLADRRGVRVSIVLADELALRIDPNDLQELVGNLLENAIDWAASRVTLSIQRESRALCLCLDDDGPGMSEDERAAVLRRGVRLDEQRPGNGLGLAIVEELVELYGGELALEAAPLGGLRVTVKLPAGASSAQR